MVHAGGRGMAWNSARCLGRAVRSVLARSCASEVSQSALYVRLENAVSGRSLSATNQLAKEIRDRFRTGQITRRKDDVMEIVPQALADEVVKFYASITDSDDKKLQFFTFLTKLCTDKSEVLGLATKYVEAYKEGGDRPTALRLENRLRQSLRPACVELFSLLARSEEGLQLLIDMRRDLLTLIERERPAKHSSLQELNTQLKETLTGWFSTGFLDLVNITWKTPCDIMEKVSEYEAVHSVRHWKDIKHRVGPYRRVFAFIHRSLPREPIVILHSALTQEPSSSVQALLSRVDANDSEKNMSQEDHSQIKTAVFYSISAPHKGLSGVDLGNSLIKRVVQELQREFPFLKDFVTLSPIPGFRQWLESFIHQWKETSGPPNINLSALASLFPDIGKPTDVLEHVLQNTSWATDPDEALSDTLRPVLLSLCCRYLLNAKRRGFALDRVTNFHSRNGASVWRLNWLGDCSPRGLQQSYGMMVNYRYDLLELSRNSNDYIQSGKIYYSGLIHQHIQS